MLELNNVVRKVIDNEIRKITKMYYMWNPIGSWIFTIVL